jgi:hypothetical protein
VCTFDVEKSARRETKETLFEIFIQINANVVFNDSEYESIICDILQLVESSLTRGKLLIDLKSRTYPLPSEAI